MHLTRSLAVSQHLSRLSVGKPHRGRVRSRLEDLPVPPPSRQGQRTSGRASTGYREDGTQEHQVPEESRVPGKGDGQDKGRGEQETPGCPPCCEAWKGHLIKPATALNETQHS